MTVKFDLMTFAALILVAGTLFSCGGGKPDGSYDDFRKGLSDKGHHKKGYGFNE